MTDTTTHTHKSVDIVTDLATYVRNLEHELAIRDAIEDQLVGTEEQAARDRHPAGKGRTLDELTAMSVAMSKVKPEDPTISAYYEPILNKIAVSVEGEDGYYLDRDTAFSLSDELRLALEVQVTTPGGVA